MGKQKQLFDVYFQLCDNLKCNSDMFATRTNLGLPTFSVLHFGVALTVSSFHLIVFFYFLSQHASVRLFSIQCGILRQCKHN